MPRTGLENEDMPCRSTGVAPVDPSRGFQRGCDAIELNIGSQSEDEIDDWFPKEAGYCRGAIPRSLGSD